MINKLVHLTILSRTILCAFLLSACAAGSTASPVKGGLPALTGNWSIHMTHSGGIMGLLRSVDVDSTGIYTVNNGRSDAKYTGQLSSQELADLVDLVNSCTYVQEQTPHGCADCFIYDIQISSADGRFRAQVDDISIDESGLGPLVLTLRGIIERELK